MVLLFNPGGHDWGKYNLDGYGIGYIVFDIIYTLFFIAACHFVWQHRQDPLIKMRNFPLALCSIGILHVYMFAVLIVYPLNGLFPCQAEFWIMSVYLPVGIGLFQAANQQLSLVSEGQRAIANERAGFNPKLPDRVGWEGPSYWSLRLRFWWAKSVKQNKYETFVFSGIIVQVSVTSHIITRRLTVMKLAVSLILYNISKRLNAYGVVGQSVGPGLCRRGWEWYDENDPRHRHY